MATTAQLLGLAWQQYHFSNYQEADNHCRRVLRAEPTNTAAMLLRGLVCQNLGKLEEAIASFREPLIRNRGR